MFRIAKVYGGERPGNLPVRGILQQDGPKNRLFRVFFGDHGCSSVVGMTKYLRVLTGADAIGFLVFFFQFTTNPRVRFRPRPFGVDSHASILASSFSMSIPV